MDKYLRSIKVVSLFEQSCKCYLTACEDKKSITLVRKHELSDPGAPPKAAEWRVKWIKGPTGALTYKCRLHSFYKKVLMVRREGAGEGQQGYLKVYQDRWPPLDQCSTAVSEWNLILKQVSFERGLGIEAQLVIEYENQRYFLAGPKSMMCNYDRFASPRLELRTAACKVRVHDWIVLQLVNAEQLLKNKDGSKKPNSTKNSNPPPPPRLPPTTNAITTTTTATTISREDAVVKSPFGSSSQMSQFPGWQVGQVVLNYFTSGGGGGGGGYSHYNSGHNVNGSGTQTNGDVNVSTEVGNTRDVSVNFLSNKSGSSSMNYGG